MPSAPAAAFIKNIKGISNPPLRSRDSSNGRPFYPVAWKMQMVIMVMDTAGQVRQITRKKCWP